MSEPMRNYEVTFIVDPVLSGEEIKATARTYVDHLKNEGCKIVHVDEMGLRQLAYPINKRTSGVYFCIEFESEDGQLISKLELALRRDERIMRFLTTQLDRYGVKYNEDKRNGLIGKVKKKEKKKDRRDRDDRRGGRGNRDRGRSDRQNKPKETAPKEETAAVKEAAPKEVAAVKEAAPKETAPKEVAAVKEAAPKEADAPKEVAAVKEAAPAVIAADAANEEE